MSLENEFNTESKLLKELNLPASKFQFFNAISLLSISESNPEFLPSPPPETTKSIQKSLIEKYLNQLNQQGLLGKEQVMEYLHNLLRKDCRPNTIRSNFFCIRSFLAFISRKGRSCLDEIIRDDIGEFIEHEQDRGLKPSSVHRGLQAVNAFVGLLIEKQIVHPDVLKRKFRIKLPESLPRAIEPEDITLLLSVIDDIRNRALILVLLRTGMRIGELLNTKVTDLNLREKRIEIFEAQKNRVGRVVYLGEDARDALDKWLEIRKPERQYLFYGKPLASLCYEAARSIFLKYLDKAGLSHKGYTLHCLRHTCASELLNAGMRLECLQQLLGHSYIEMTRRYARLTDNTRREEYFKAMSIIEKGGVDGHYRFDYTVS